jgi:undecaprenyl-diphosphatase
MAARIIARMSIWLLAIILGLVEGITEFIPVSSTGHLLIAEHFLHAKEKAPFLTTDLFNAFIQCCAMLAALPLFRARLATLKQWREPVHRSYFLKLGVALVITIAGALVFKYAAKKITGDDSLLPKTVMPVAWALMVGGVLFVLVEGWLKGRQQRDDVTWAVAIAIGVAQVAALVFPGASRSGSTILLALAMGLGRAPATEFSFLLGVPTLFAAGAKTMWDALKVSAPIEWGPLILASVVASISSFLAVRWLLGYVRSHTFVGFGWYRIGLGALLFTLYFTSGLR